MKNPNQLKEYNAKRNFEKTAEPRGAVYAKVSKRLAFVVQKHEASHLHYDIRLEVDGVMKSWACPKGPSFDPTVKRLAVEVEDHPTSYNAFEGMIPSGEYGGGSIMVWDHGHYTVDGAETGDDPEALMRDGLLKGKLSFTFHGKKLRGSFALVRTRMATGSKKHQWLLIKHKDSAASASYDPISEEARSSLSRRTMDTIQREGMTSDSLNPSAPSSPRPARPVRTYGRNNKSKTSTALGPMLLHTSPDLPRGKEWAYEQKLDGVRLLAYADPTRWVVVSRLGNDKSLQFPELGAGIKAIAERTGGPVILDGEVVAIQGKGKGRGEPLGFQVLQRRIHLDDPRSVAKEVAATPVAFYIFDALLAGDVPLVEKPWSQRREILEQIFKDHAFPKCRLIPYSSAAKAMQVKAKKGGWEGLIAKDKSSLYFPGTRTKNWLKWKTAQLDEFVIGGWTEPKGGRKLIGSLLLGTFDERDQLVFTGHVGSGLDAKSLATLYAALVATEVKTSPFATKITTNDAPHWVQPRLVAEVKFQERTEAGILRQGTFLGLRDDKLPLSIRGREPTREEGIRTETIPETDTRPPAPKERRISRASDLAVTKALNAIHDEGVLPLKEGELRLTHLDRVIFPNAKITKRDLLLYYSNMAPYILSAMKDRPLVLRRFPHGINAKDFYQQAPDDGSPGRIATIEGEGGERQKRLIGGDLITLLYTVQMGCISYDPWHSRIHQLDTPDYTIIDLDPLAGTSFETVRSVALACLDFLEEKGLHGALKTSGATGLHIYLPLPPGTSLETGRLAAEIICTEVAARHPLGTVERSVRKRKRGSVYLDSQQNYLSKSVAGVWAVRARDFATVSTPITRQELVDGAVPEDFTCRTVGAEAAKRNALWTKALSRSIPIERLGEK